MFIEICQPFNLFQFRNERLQLMLSANLLCNLIVYPLQVFFQFVAFHSQRIQV